MTAAEAVAALDTFLNDAMLEGADHLRVIHGRSGDRLRSAVHARLAQLPPVRAFRLDPRNPGVTIVTL
jgi:dsDNA-specific endonuclease/ATPase MutS2